jgi:pilus assembly protein CpaF
MGGSVDAVSRVVERILDSTTSLDRTSVTVAARLIAEDEAPLDPEGAARGAVAALVGLGPLEPLLADPAVSDVLVNGPHDVWVERSGRLERTEVRFRDAAAVVAAVERVIAPLGLRLDRAAPAVDARLPDGSRLHAAVPPASVDGPVVAVRRFTAAVPDLDAMVAVGAIREEGAALLREAVGAGRNLLVCGATGSGKTTLLNVLSGEIPPTERVVTIEEAAELRLSGHVVRLEARPANAEGAGEITMRALVRHALRMRPDRIVVGEVRGPEALDFLQAMSTGHAGSMGTVHASGPDEALWRLETLALSGGDRLVPESVHRQVMGAVDVVVLVTRASGARRVVSVAAVSDRGVEEVYRC